MTYKNQPCRIVKGYTASNGDRMRLLEINGNQEWVRNPIIKPGKPHESILGLEKAK